MSIQAAIEVGSGKVRYCVAEIKDGAIQEILEEGQQELKFADIAHLNGNVLTKKIEEECHKVLAHFKERALQLKAKNIKAVATDLFRDPKKAKNGKEFIENLSKKLSINIEIIDQDYEGKLGYLTIAHIVSKYTPQIPFENLLTWDSGRSSAQLTYKQGIHFEVYKSPFGVIPIQKIVETYRKEEGRDQETLTPFSSSEIEKVISHLIEESLPLPPKMEKLISSLTTVRKYGSAMLVRTFGPLENKVLTKEEVKETLLKFAYKNDDEIIQMTGGHKDVDPQMLMLSLIGMLAMMLRFSIPSIRFAETPAGNTYGILLSSLNSPLIRGKL